MTQATKDEARRKYQEHRELRQEEGGDPLMPGSDGRTSKTVPIAQGDTPATFEGDDYLELTALPEPKPIGGDWLGSALGNQDAIASEPVDVADVAPTAAAEPLPLHKQPFNPDWSSDEPRIEDLATVTTGVTKWDSNNEPVI